MIIEALGGVLLFCLGILLGSAWITRVLQPKLRRQAEEHRRLIEEWSAVRTARQRSGRCPRCTTHLSDQDRHYAPTLVEDPSRRSWDPNAVTRASG